MADFWIAGTPAASDDIVTIRSPLDGTVVGETSNARPDQVEQAVAAAASVFPSAARLPASARAAALDHVSATLARRAGEVAELITAENGKPAFWAKAEVSRAVSTFRWAAEEARRFSGEMMRLDTDPAATGRMAVVRRFARGPVLGITPFNFPLNLVAHKVAPAIAVGAPILVKPAPATPLTALLLGEILAQTELAAGMFSILPLPNDRASALVADPRLPVVSFTGSSPVGAQIKAAVPEKHVTLELGGNAAVLICSDYTDLDWAAQRVALYSNYQGGQSCIAVQRVFVHSSLADEFTAKLVEAVSKLDFDAQVGPLISEPAAQKVQQWVDESGGRVLAGGSRQGTRYEPTVLTDVPRDAKVVTEEVFGPVLVLSIVDTDDAGFDAINDSNYGLQAGVFTTDMRTAFKAHTTLNVGGVIIGDVPSYRADPMPYGGAKGSGVGREGLRSAMQDYTEARVMVLTGLEL